MVRPKHPLAEVGKIARSMIEHLLDAGKPGINERARAMAEVGVRISDIIQLCRKVTAGTGHYFGSAGA